MFSIALSFASSKSNKSLQFILWAASPSYWNQTRNSTSYTSPVVQVADNACWDSIFFFFRVNTQAELFTSLAWIFYKYIQSAKAKTANSSRKKRQGHEKRTRHVNMTTWLNLKFPSRISSPSLGIFKEQTEAQMSSICCNRILDWWSTMLRW